MESLIAEIKKEFVKLENKKKALVIKRYFKSSEIFLGVPVPKLREIAKKYAGLLYINELKNIFTALIKSNIHEQKLLGLFLLEYYDRKHEKEEILNLSLKYINYFDNWDLTDFYSSDILGHFCIIDCEKRKILYDLLKNRNFWVRRIAMISTIRLIRNGEFDDAINIARVLCHEENGYIQKAVGWMLREIGKKGKEGKRKEIKFLKENKPLPSILFSYATEKFSKQEKSKLR